MEEGMENLDEIREQWDQQFALEQAERREIRQWILDRFFEMMNVEAQSGHIAPELSDPNEVLQIAAKFEEYIWSGNVDRS